MSKINNDDYIVASSRHPVFRKWWVRYRQYKDGQYDVLQIYVPLWAWPLEILHRAIFGYPRLESIKEIN